MDVLDKLIEHTDFSEEPDGCWLWNRSVGSHGYGQTWISKDDPLRVAEDHGQRVVLVHRVAYERLVGPLPIDRSLEVDHVCHSSDPTCVEQETCPHRRCWNPDHLEAVTPAVNNRRRNIRHGRYTGKTHCDAGHALEGDNLYIRPNGNRGCRPCRSEATRRSRARRAT